MKRRFSNLSSICIIVICAIFMYRHSEASVFADTYIAHEDEKVSYGNNIVCQIDGNIDSKYADMVEAELNWIPSSLRSKFVESGWHIYVTDENLARNYYGDSKAKIFGSTFYTKDLILMSDSELAIKAATIHEFGHWLDDYLGYASSSRDFTAIHSSEKISFLRMINWSYNVDTASEYFAQAFNYYIKYPACLKKAAPQTYAYIDYYVQAVMQQ